MTGLTIISTVLFVWCFGVGSGEQAGYDYTTAKQEETEVEIQKVEVYEVPWIGDQQPQPGYSPSQPQYGPPSQEYGPPPVYGPPQVQSDITTTEYPDSTTIASSVNTTNSTSSANLAQRAKLESGVLNNGQYYIYHPSGLLQKVMYLTRDDRKNMEFSGRLSYKNVDPIKGPIYTYDPNTYVFSRLNKK